MIESVIYTFIIPGCPKKVYRVNYKDGRMAYHSDENVPTSIMEFILEADTKAHDIEGGTIFKK